MPLNKETKSNQLKLIMLLYLFLKSKIDFRTKNVDWPAQKNAVKLFYDMSVVIGLVWFGFFV